MSEEKTTVTEKIGFFKKSWKTIVTGVVCAVVGAGVTIGADAAKIQETITKSQANQLAIAAAAYSAEQVLSKVTVVATSEKKLEAIKEAVDATTTQIPTILAGVTAAKETAAEATTTVTTAVKEAKETKTETTPAKEPAVTPTAPTTPATTPAAKTTEAAK